MTHHRPATYYIVEDDLTGAEVTGLLAFHLAEMHQLSPPCKVHAMPVERLREPDVTFYSAWDGERLAAVGALRELEATRGELKSMRAVPEYRGKGAGEAILLHLVDEARRRGYAWLGLETGRPAARRHRDSTASTASPSVRISATTSATTFPCA